MSQILAPLIARLKEEGSAKWELIAKAAGVERHLPKKLVYGERPNPTIKSIEPLIRYFSDLDTKAKPRKKAEA
jgi:hypothetical protein